MKYFKVPLYLVFVNTTLIAYQGSIMGKMAICVMIKVFSLIAFCGVVSATWRCPDKMTLVANLTSNGTFLTEIGFNTTFPFVETVDGNVTMVVPWVNISRMWAELNFTAQQRTPLTELLSQHPNVSFAALIYDCNITALNCTVDCVFGERPTDGFEESNTLGMINEDDVCTNGYNLSMLTNHSHWLEKRWTKLCDYFITLQYKEQNLAWLKLMENSTVTCEFNTSTPLRYNITLHGPNLTRQDEFCIQNANRTVMCSITNSTEYIYNMSLLKCVIHRPPWPVWVSAKFNFTDEELEEYQYEDGGDYYYYEDDGEYYYYDEYEGEYYDDSEEEEKEEENEQEKETVGAKSTPPTHHHAKRVGRPRGDKKKPGSENALVLVVGIIALATVGVLVILFRKKMDKPPGSAIYNRLRSPY